MASGRVAAATDVIVATRFGSANVYLSLTSTLPDPRFTLKLLFPLPTESRYTYGNARREIF